jgi:hypothetical protein
MKHLPMDKIMTTFFPLPALPGISRFWLAIVGLVAWSMPVSGQGWEIYFGGNSEDIGQAVIQTKDHGYAITGFSESFGADGDLDVYAIRTDVDGKMLWSNVYDEGWTEHGYSIIETPDHGLLIVGDIRQTPVSNANVYLLKIDVRGKQQWSKQFGGAASDVGKKIIATSDGGYLIAGRTNSFGAGKNDVYLLKTDANGNEVWSRTYGTAEDEEGNSVVEMGGNYYVAGTAFSTSGDPGKVLLLKTDLNGNEVWTKFFGTIDVEEALDLVKTKDGNIAITGYTGSNSDVFLLKASPNGDSLWNRTFGGVLGDRGNDLLETPDGNLVITGTTELTIFDSDVLLMQTDPDGNLKWTTSIGRNSHVDEGLGLTQTLDGGFVVAGYNSQFGNIFNDVSLIKANSQGSVYTNHLKGKVFIDDNDCVLEPGEAGLHNWIIRAASVTKTFFGTTDANGFYDITLDTGVYQVSVLVKNNYWNACIAQYNVNFVNLYDTLTRNFPMLAQVSCPLLEVDVSAPVVQNCSNIGYTVSYCNAGTLDANTPEVHLILDGNLTLTGSSIPVAFQVDSLYVFNIDALSIDECGSFNFTAASDCNGIPGQSYSVRAQIFPDSICLPPSPQWDNASIKVNGYCDVNTVKFSVKNAGIGNMMQPLEYIVIEDHVMFLKAPFDLDAGKDTTITIPSTAGATYRIIAEQSPGHPGNSYPTIAVEGCTTTPGVFSTGYKTELQEDENDPFISIDVQESISSTDYIFLRGYPKGYLRDGKLLIPADTDIEYHIYFRNAGTDTITRLVIRDTLPASLDLGSIVPGASSHSYNFEVYGEGVLKFTFNDIHLLPDGDAASQGFVKFKVSQKPNNPVGTEIPNSAAVFLGFNAPAQTVTYTHVVGGGDLLEFVLTDVEEPKVPGVTIQTYPNPFAAAIEFEVEGMSFNALTISVFDVGGQLVRRETSQGNRLRLYRNDLPAGMYVFKLESSGRLLNSGKIIAR